MIGMQYKVILPSNYDMDMIRERVKNNGFKMDGFQDLKWKMYLIAEKDKNGNLQNEYSPLYLWEKHDGMNKFLFEGFYDNILNSFGWQHVNIGVPILDTTSENIKNARFAVEITYEIEPSLSLRKLVSEMKGQELGLRNDLESITIYNPDKWKYTKFYFLQTLEDNVFEFGKVYTILHISQ
ncbi:DUF4865 family protein [Pelosinus sp. sgz500959]|uniref:DUF4865 family protein n=1 Tax=Pelosinus sp. sgz500959 TaxID=3242472 RepID=UPI0036702A99